MPRHLISASLPGIRMPGRIGCHFCDRLEQLTLQLDAGMNRQDYERAVEKLFDQADRASRARRTYGSRNRRNRRNLT